MAVPTYEEIMLPLLKLIEREENISIIRIIERLVYEMNISEADAKELLSSGRERKFNNRVRWARFYLLKAGLLDSPKRGTTVITKTGKDILKAKPKQVNTKYLKNIPTFKKFINQEKKGKKETKDISVSKSTPEDLLESSYQILNESLASELLDKVKKAEPTFFEKLVVELLLKMGYGGSRKDAGEAIGKSHDGGIDGIIKEDKLGLDVIYIQAKRWENTVGRPIVQAFAGSLEGVRARRGIIITTSQFSKDAQDYVNNIEKKIVLIDGQRLTQLMIDYDLAVSNVATYELKRIDIDYFED
ncbi:MAG: restriction endonuclease [Candidatus Zixiibacteriota bacterium]